MNRVSRAKFIAALPAGDLLVGVRPEELKVGEGREAAVALVEPVGSHTILTLDAAAAILRAVVPGTWNGGASCRITAPPASVHLFDAATGVRR